MLVSRSALLPYSAEKIYDIIADVRSYPSFLNWCSGVEVVDETEQEVTARLIISYGKLDFSFTTKNMMTLNESVEMSLVDGPFSNLAGQWTIQPLGGEACKASIDMDFSFDSKVTQKLFGRVFQNVISAQLDAFQKRANQLYGNASA